MIKTPLFVICLHFALIQKNVVGFAPAVPFLQQASKDTSMSSRNTFSREQTHLCVSRDDSRSDKEFQKTRLFSGILASREVSSDVPGDEAAYFDLDEQSLADWLKFTAATGAVLASMSYLWFLPWGPHLGDEFVTFVQSLAGTTDPAVTVALELVFFAIAHSGLAGLRPYAEEIVGARIWRVIFACVSLPLALSCISFFINHAHEGVKFWSLPYNDPILHSTFWVINFISFLFLYPSTFNLLEVAAIEKPQLHLWKPSGIIRITRHPQAVGQLLWCIAHTAYLGTSTALSASTILVLHHAYSVWHGDRRLKEEHGEAFERVKEVTSVVPFQAIWEGRQQLPDNYLGEFARGPYLLVVGGTIAAYSAHPFMMAGAALLHW